MNLKRKKNLVYETEVYFVEGKTKQFCMHTLIFLL